jgi:uncharacterized protein DUF4265
LFAAVFERTRLGRSGRDPEQIATVGVLVDGESLVREEVPVESVEDGRYRVLATPGLAQGFAAEDVITVGDDGHVRVLERAGNVGVQILADAHDPDAVRWLVDETEHLGGWLDGFGKGVVVLTIPVRSGFESIESLVRAYVDRADEAVEWYYANVYADDGQTPLGWW